MARPLRAHADAPRVWARPALKVCSPLEPLNPLAVNAGGLCAVASGARSPLQPSNGREEWCSTIRIEPSDSFMNAQVLSTVVVLPSAFLKLTLPIEVA